MACAQQHADLPGCDKTWQQTQFNHRRFHRLPPCASPESHSRHSYHATLNLKMRSVVRAEADYLFTNSLSKRARSKSGSETGSPQGFFSEAASFLPEPC